MQLKKELTSYIEASFPIVYINSFEESKVDEIIKEVMGGRKGFEWNGAKGFCDFKSKQILFEGKSLAETLMMLEMDDELYRKYLVIKDIHLYLDEPKVITCLKDIAIRISTGQLEDSAVIIVSSVLKIPKELEKFITILEMEYPTQEEIIRQIRLFSEEQSVPISDALLEDMSMAFKGLTEFEIENLLFSALSNDGLFSRSDLKLIFSQKKQMIMKSGILEMIQVNEKPEDIGGLENMKDWLLRKAKVFQSINKAIAWGVK